MIDTNNAVSDDTVRTARRAVLAVFFLNGAVFASWAVNIPTIRARFALNTGALGLVLLAIAAGAVIALLLSAGLIARFGSRNVIITTVIGYCGLLPLLLHAPHVSTLVALLVCFGACNGAMDVAMNTHGVAVEERLGRPTMSTFHAFFSMGGLLGAGIGGLLLGARISPQLEVFGVSAALLVLAAFALPRLFPAMLDRGSGVREPAFALPHGALLGIALLAFMALVAEGAMADWSAVYLHDFLRTGAGFAASGYAAFSLAMTVGRFVGDTLRARISAVNVLRASGVVVAGGLGVALLVGQPIAALVGFACVGIGLSNIVPVLFSAAGATPGIATGTAIAAVAAAGYFGFLVGPPLIGGLARLISLPHALFVVVIFAVLIAALAGMVRACPR